VIFFATTFVSSTQKMETFVLFNVNSTNFTKVLEKNAKFLIPQN
jgi:hypothetical protein